MSDPASFPVDVLILAAGRARRFGSCKLLAQWQGVTLLEHVLQKAVALPVRSVNLVLGGYATEISTFLRQRHFSHVNLFYCDSWAAGIGQSLAYGVAQLPNGNAVMILLADQPLIELSDLQQMLEHGGADVGRLVCAEFAGTLGVPALFPARFKNGLLQCCGDRGAKALLHEHAAEAVKIALARAAVDIDSPSDLALLPAGPAATPSP